MEQHSNLTIRIVKFIVDLCHDCDMLPTAYIQSYTDSLTSSSEETIYKLFHQMVENLEKKKIYPQYRFMGTSVGWSDFNDKAYLMYIDLANQLIDQLFEDLILVPR